MGREGQTGCEGTEWESETSVRCMVGHGAQGTRRVVMTAGGMVCSQSQTSSYDLAMFSTMADSNVPSTGASSVTLSGSRFGPSSSSVRMSISSSVAESSSWVSQSSLLCLSGFGSQTTNRLSLTIQGKSGSLSQSFTFDLDLISSVAPPNSAAHGRRAELLSGHSFGTCDHTTEARIGSSACQATQWRAGTSVRCRISPGISTRLTAILTAGSGFVSGSRSDSYTYDVQATSEVLGELSSSTNETWRFSNAPRVGMQVFTVLGEDYGVADYTVSSRLGYSNCETSVWTSDSSITCRITAGIPNEQTVILTLQNIPDVGPRISTRVLMWSYNEPSIQVIGAFYSRRGTRLTAGNAPRFSRAAEFVISSANLCEVNTSSGDHCIRYLQNDSSMTNATMVCAYHPDFCPGRLFVQGASFGPWETSLGTRFGGTSTEVTLWTSDSSLASRSASGTALPDEGNVVSVTVSKTRSSLTHAFSLDVPLIVSILPGNTPGTGGISISMLGSNFGSWDNSLSAKIGPFECRATRWISDSTVIVQSPGAYGRFLTMDLVSWGPGQAPAIFLDKTRVGEITVAVSYDLPVVSHIHPVMAAPFQRKNISLAMRIDGQNFGGRDPSPSLSLGGRGLEGEGSTACERVQWFSDESIWCLALPSGVGKLNDVSVTIAEQSVTVTAAFTYFAPSSIAIDWNRSKPEYDLALMEIHGVHFGNFDSTLSARFGGSATEATEWMSDSSLASRSSSGVGLQKDVGVTVAVQYRTSIYSFSYPIITVAEISECKNSHKLMGWIPLANTTTLVFNKSRCPGGIVGLGNLTGNRVNMTTNCSNICSHAYNWERDATNVNCSHLCLDTYNFTGNSTNRTTSCNNLCFNRCMNRCVNSSGPERQDEAYCQDEIRYIETMAPFECGITHQKTKTNAPTYGAMILLSGNRFGLSDYSPAARIQRWAYQTTTIKHHTVDSIEFTAAMATVWTSDSSVLAKMGAGLPTTFSDAALAVTVDQQVSTQMYSSGIFVSYDTGVLSHIHAHNDIGRMPSKTLFMSGAGMVDYSSRIRMYGTACESSTWKSDSIMSCKAATGVIVGGYQGNNGAVVLTVFHFAEVKEGIVSLTEAFSYDRALIRSAVVDIVERQIVLVKYRAHAPVNVTWKSKTPGLSNFGNQRQKAHSGLVGLTYIEGSNFAYRDVTQDATVGQTSCQSTRWVRDDLIICRATSGPYIGTNRILVTISGPDSIATISQAISFDNALLSAPSIRNVPPWGGLLVKVNASSFALSSEKSINKTVIHLRGMGLEMNDASISVAFGDSVCEVTSWISDTVISTMTTRGLDRSHSIIISGGNSVGSLTEAHSFDTPAVILHDNKMSAGFQKNLPVEGGAVTSLSGYSFGSDLSRSAAARLGGTACEQSVWRSDSSIICKTTRGHPSGLVPDFISHTMPANAFRLSDRLLGYKSFAHQGQVVITVGILIATATNAFTYDAHVLGSNNAQKLTGWAINEPRAGVMGQVMHEVKGFGFASFDTSPSHRIGRTTTENSVWVSDTMTWCKSSNGLGFDVAVQVTIALETARVSDVFTYDFPSMLWMIPSYSKTTASQEVYVLGRDLGFVDFTYRTRVGSSTSEMTSWISSTSLALRLSSGLSEGLGLTLTAAGWAPTSTWQIPFQYLYPSTSQLSPGNGPISGGYTVTIMGENFGYWDSTVSSRLGEKECQASVWVADTATYCKAPEIGGRVKVEVVISVAGQYDELYESADPFIYDAPRVTGISKINSPCTGHAYFMLEGDQFGTETTRTEVKIGNTMAPHLPWDNDDSWKYQPEDPQAALKRLGWISDSRIGFQSPPGTGIVETVALSIIRLRIPLENEKDPGAPIFWYDRPNVYNITPANAPTYTTYFMATVTGKNYGVSNQSMEAKFGLAPYDYAWWTSDTSMTSLVPSGVGQNVTVAARVDAQIGYTESIFSYDLPSLSKMVAANKAPLDDVWLQILGKNFFIQDTTVSTRLGGSTAESSEWVSDSAVNVKASVGSTGTRSTAISIRHATQLEGTITESLTFDRPQLWAPPKRQANHAACSYDVLPDFCKHLLTNSWAIGGHDMTIQGSAFGSKYDMSLAAGITQTHMQQSKWISITSLHCKIPAGAFLSRGVSITAAEIHSSVSNVLSYDSVGLMSLLKPLNSPTFNPSDTQIMPTYELPGKMSVGLLGSQLGLQRQSLQSRVGSTGSEFSYWTSETSLQCKVPDSIGLTLRVIITAARRAHGSLTETKSYDSPLTSSLYLTNGPRGGTRTTIIYGQMFAPKDYTLKASLGGCSPPFCRHRACPTAIMACRTTPWISDTVAGCLPSFGVIDAATLTLTAALQDSSLTESFTYDLWPIAFPSRPSNGRPYSQYDSQIFLMGRNMGERPLSQAGRIGGTHCEWTRWVSSSTLNCKSASGTGKVYPVRMTVEVGYDAIATACDSFTYDAISIVRFGVFCNETVNFIETAANETNWTNLTNATNDSNSTNQSSCWVDAPNITNLSNWTCPPHPVPLVLCKNGSSTSSNKPTAGGLSISILGRGFGNAFYSSSVRLSSTTLASSQWVSDSTVICKVVAGQGRSLRASLTSGNSISSASDVFSFDAVYISLNQTRPVNSLVSHSGHLEIQRLGQYILTIQGRNMGIRDSSLAPQHGSTSCEYTAWIADSSIFCRATTGTQGSTAVMVTLGASTGSSTSIVTYDSPSLMGTLNRSHVSIVLSHYEQQLNMPNSSLICNATSNCSAFNFTNNSISAINCSCREGVKSIRTQKPVYVETIEQVMCSAKLSQNGTCKLLGNIPIILKSNILLAGNALGNVDGSIRSRVGSTSTEFTMWVSTSSLLARPTSGISLQNWGSQKGLTSMAIVVTAGLMAGGSLTEGLSFDLAMVSFLTAQNAPMFVAFELQSDKNMVLHTLEGNNFGAVENSVLGVRFGLTASQSTSWISDTSVLCGRASGSFSSRSTVLTSGAIGSSGSLTETFTYDNTEFGAREMQPLNSASRGKASLTILLQGLTKMQEMKQVSGLGFFDPSAQTRAGGSASEASLWQSDSIISARSASGLSIGLTVVISVGAGQIGTSSGVFSYDLHSVASLEIKQFNDSDPSYATAMSQSNVPKTGTAWMYISGLNFGTQDRSAGKVRTGGSAAEVTLWVSDTILNSMIAGGTGRMNGTDGVGWGLVATCGIRTVSWSLPLSYDLASLSSYANTNHPIFVPREHVFYGSGFGHNADFSSAARFRSSAAMATSWKSESSVAAKTPFGTFKFHDSIVTVGIDVRCSQTNVYTYDGVWPYLSTSGNTSGLSPFPNLGNGPSSGTPLTTGFLAYGSGFDIMDKSPSLRIGGTGCETSMWHSDTAISAQLSQGSINRKMLSVAVTTDKSLFYLNSISQLFSYQSPLPLPSSNSSNTSSNTFFRETTQRVINVQGISFGTVSGTLKTRMGSTACESTSWSSETSLSCHVSMGIGGLCPLVVTAGSQGYVPMAWPTVPAGWRRSIGTISEAISYDVPASKIDITHQMNLGVTDTARVLTFSSYALGHTDYTIRSAVGGTMQRFTEWLSTDSIRARPTFGSLSTHSFVLTAGNRDGTVTEAISYDHNVMRRFVITDYQDSTCPFDYCAKGSDILGTESPLIKWEYERVPKNHTSLICAGTCACEPSQGIRSGSIYNRNGTGNYSNDATCVWVISVAPVILGKPDRISISFPSFDTQEGHDYVRIFQCPEPTCKKKEDVAKISGRVSNSTVYEVSSGVLVLEFTSDVNVTGRGFEATWRVDSPKPGDWRYMRELPGIVEVHGRSNNLDISSMIRFGNTMCEETKWHSLSSIMCHVPEGCAFAGRVVMSAGVLASSISTGFTYYRDITSMEAPDGKVQGGLSLTLNGMGFGESDYSPAIRMADTFCDAAGWFSDTSVRCKVPGSIQRPERMLLVMRPDCPPDNLQACEQLWVPIILETKNAPPSPHNTTQLTIVGLAFQLEDPTPSASIGFTPCEVTKWVSDTSLNCLVGSGAGTNKGLVVTVTPTGEETNTITLEKAFKYDEGTVSVMKPVNLPVSGGAITTLIGINFAIADYSPDARIGPIYGAHEAFEPRQGWTQRTCKPTLWTSDSTVACYAVSILAQYREISIEIGGVRGTTTQIISMDVPLVLNVRSNNNSSNIVAMESTNVVVVGKNFGASVLDYGVVFKEEQDRQRMAWLGHTSCFASEWVSDTSMFCRTATSNFGQTLRAMVTAGVSKGSQTEALSFDMPRIIAFEGNSPATMVVIKPVNVSTFGRYDVSLSARVQQSATEATVWFSMTSISALISSGSSQTKFVSVTAGILTGSVCAIFSFDMATVSAIGIDGMRRNSPTSSTISIVIHGQNYGLAAYCMTARISSSSCETTDWKSVTSIASLVTSSTPGATRQVVITHGEVPSTTTSALSMDSVSIKQNFQKMNAAAYVGAHRSELVLSSNGFGSYSPTAEARIGFTGADATLWISDSEVIARHISGQLVKYSLRLTMGTTFQSLTGSFTYDKAMLNGWIVANSPPSGHINAWLGINIASTDFTGRLGQGNSNSDESLWISDSSINCLAAAGVGGTRTVTITLGTRRSSLSEAMSFDQAIPLSVTKGRNYPTIQTPVILAFACISWPQPPEPIWICTNTSNGSNGSNVSNITCVAVWNITFHNSSNISNTSNTSNTSNITRHPNCSRFEPYFFSPTLNTSINDTGVFISSHNVGIASYTIKVSSGGSGHEMTQWIGESSIVSLSPSGSGASVRLLITAGLQEGTSSSLVSYNAPQISTMQPVNRALSGGILTLSGFSFGGSDLTIGGRILGESSSAMTTWLSDSSLACRTLISIAGSKWMAVTSGLLQGTRTESFSFDHIVVSSLSERNSAERRLSPIGVSSLHFHPKVTYSPLLRLDGTSSERSLWISSTTIECNVAMSMPSNPNMLSLVLVLTSASRDGTLTEAHTYDQPELSGITRPNSPMGGDATFSVAGANFGLGSFTHKLWTGFTACEASTWRSDSSVESKSPAGIAASHTSVQISVLVLVTTRTDMWTYDAPSSSTSRSLNVAGISAPKVQTVFGLFAETSYSSVLRAGTLAERSTWISTSAVVMKTSRGLGHSIRFLATAGMRSSTLTEMVSFDHSLVVVKASGDIRTNYPATGATMITMQGMNLGSRSHTTFIRVGMSATEVTLWTSDSNIAARSVSGFRQTGSVVVTAGMRSESAISAVSWDIKMISSIVFGNIPPMPKPALMPAAPRLSGANLGTTGLSVSMRTGETTASETLWLSETSLWCKVSRGVSATLTARVTCHMSTGSSSSMLSYDSPKNFAIIQTNTPNTGSVLALLFGVSLSASDITNNARISGSTCEQSLWISGSTVICRISAGVAKWSGMPHSVVLTVTEREGSVSGLFTYLAPSLSSSRLANGPWKLENEITVTGMALSTVSQTHRARIGISSVEATRWESESSLLCTIPGGVGRSQQALVTAGVYRASLTQAYTYDAMLQVGIEAWPSDTDVDSELYGLSNRWTDGSWPVTLTGSGFAFHDSSPSMRLSSTSAEHTMWLSNSNLICKSFPHGKASLRVKITGAGALGTKTEVYSYDALILSLVGPANRPGKDSSSATIMGSMFGRTDHVHFTRAGRVSFTGSACEATEWISISSLRCTNSGLQNPGGSLGLVLTMSDLAGSVSQTWSYDSCFISKPGTLGNFASTGVTSITIVGFNYGFEVRGVSVASRTGLTGAEYTTWISDSSITSRTSGGSLGSTALIVTAGIQDSSLTLAMSYDLAIAKIKGRANLASTGAISMLVRGSGFGLQHFSNFMRVGSTSIERTEWTSDTGITSQVAQGTGGTLRMKITADQRIASLSSVHSYNLPDVNVNLPYCKQNKTAICSHVPPFGCVGDFRGLKLVGFVHVVNLILVERFYNYERSPFDLTYENPMEALRVHTSIESAYCPGQMNSTKENECTFRIVLPCSVLKASPGNFSSPQGIQNLPAPRCCGSALLISGSGFGSTGLMTSQLRVGDTANERTEWFSDSMIWIKSAYASGNVATMKVAITSNQRGGSITGVISYDRPTVRSARIEGLLAPLLEVKFFCAGFLNSNGPVLDITKGLPVQENLPPVLDVDDGLNSTQLIARANEILLFEQLDDWKTSGNKITLHGFIDHQPCVSIHLRQPSNLSAAAVGIEFACQLATPVPEHYLNKTLMFSPSIAVFASQNDLFQCLKIERRTEQEAVCLGHGETSSTPEQTLKALCTTKSSTGKLFDADFANFTASAPIWKDIEPPSCEGTPPYQGEFSANEPPRRGMSVRMLALAGKDMGLHHITPMAVVGWSSAERSLWTSSSLVTCRISAGVKSTMHVLVTSGQRTGTLTELVSYDAPKIRDAVDWHRINIPTTDSLSLYITGSSFGEMDPTAIVRVAGSAAESTNWVGDSSVAAMSTAGAFNHTVVRLTVEQRLDGSLSGAVSYDSPLDTNVAPTRQPSTGKSTITVVGFNFASFDTTSMVRLGGSACEASRWVSATTLVCRLASGVGSAHSLIVTIFKQSSPYSYDDVDIRLNPVDPFQFSFEAPAPESALTKSGFGGFGSTRGGWLVTIQGRNFGSASDLTRVIVESSIWSSPGHEGVVPEILTRGRVECKIPRASLCKGCGDSSMYDARNKGHYTEIGALWTEANHPRERDQLLCMIPAGFGQNLGAIVAVSDQQGKHHNMFSYIRPTLSSVSSQDFCSEGTCGALASRESFIFTTNPSEGDITVDRRIYLRGDNFGPALAVESTRGTSSMDASSTMVHYGEHQCSDIKVLAGGTLVTCMIPSRAPGLVGCAVEKVKITVGGQVSAEASKNAILSLEAMPLVVPPNVNKKATVWIHGDGAGLTMIFGRKPTGTTWSPVRTTMGRPYRVRPGSRSDDFKLACDMSPQPVVMESFGGSCEAILVSLAQIPLVSQVPSIPKPASPSLLGAGARCYWRSSAEFHVIFGSNAAITINQNPPATLRLRPGVVFVYGAPSYSADTELLVETPVTPYPRIYSNEPDTKNEAQPYAEALTVYLEGEATIGICDKLVLTAHVPRASGSRESGLVFEWSSTPDLAAVRRASGEGMRSARIEVATSEEDFDTSVAYTITVRVRNWLGQEGTAAKTVTREQVGMPTVYIMGNSVQKVFRDEILVLGAKTVLPPCVGAGCEQCMETVNDDGWDGASARLEFQWSVAGENADSPLAKQVGIRTQASLVLGSQVMMTLELGRTYTFTAEASVWIGFMTNNIQRFQSKASVDIKVQAKPPVVRIKHGNRHVQWGLGVVQKRLMLDASQSFDPDAQPGSPRLRYEWFLDCSAMFLKLPQFLKDRFGVNRKTYLAACQSTTLASKMMEAANEVITVKQEDGTDLKQYGQDVFDTFELTQNNEGIPITDLQTLHPKEGTFEFPVELIIGLRLTDVDGASQSDTVSILLTSEALKPSFSVGLEPLFTSAPRPTDRMVLRIDAETRKKQKQSQENIKFVWSCDGSSRHIPLQGAPGQIGVLNLPAGLFEGGITYTIKMTAIWQDGKSVDTWVHFKAAEGPYGGNCVFSSPNATAMIDRLTVDCPLWTTAEADLLPITYSFAVDIGGAWTGTTMLLRDAQHSPSHSNFLLPSSRATVYDAEHGWILCRINCPVDFVTEVRDIAQTVTRWKTTLHTLRPGCADNVAPCTNAVMLDIIDTALRSVDIFAADLQPFNSLMILMAVELSDMDMYAANSTAGAEPGYARLRKESPEDRTLDSSEVATITKKMRSKQQERMMRTRVETLSFLRNLETQGLYEALQQDIAEALDVDVSTVHVSSSGKPKEPKNDTSLYLESLDQLSEQPEQQRLL